jgi:hypothetical protein
MTVFHEPLNLRAQNIERIEAHARELNVSWTSVVEQLMLVERIARARGRVQAPLEGMQTGGDQFMPEVELSSGSNHFPGAGRASKEHGAKHGPSSRRGDSSEDEPEGD